MLGTTGRIPALLAALAAAAGIALSGLVFKGSSTASVAARALPFAGLLLCLPAAVNLVVGRRRSAGFPELADLALLAALALAGSSHYYINHRAIPEDHVSSTFGSGSARLAVRIVEVRPSPAGHVNVVLRAAEIADASDPAARARKASGLVWGRWPEGESTPAVGDAAVLTGELRSPAVRRNPGAFDFAFYLRNRRIHNTMSDVRVLSREQATRRANVRRWIYRTLPARVPGMPGEVLRGLLLGTGRELPEELNEAFRRSGTIHVLAVSGLHVGFIVMMIHALLRCLRVPRRASRLLMLPALAGFILIVGARPSVIRASVMAAFLMTAALLERRPSALNTLGAAALALLIVRPGSLFDLGFLLSFSAVGGILLLQQPIEKSLSGVLAVLGPWRSRVAAPLALSLSAQAGVAPLLIGVFGEVSVVSPLANLAAVPLAGLSVASGITLLALAPAGNWPASAFAACAWGCVRLLVLVADVLGGAPWATVRVASRLWPAALLGTVALCVRLRATSAAGRRAGLAALAGSTLLAAALVLVGPGRSVPRVVFFDVGQGDSILLELPHRRYVLVDAGPGPAASDRAAWSGTRDTGRDVVLPYLKRAGVVRLEALVITHAHGDHFGGAASVLRGARVDNLYLPPGGREDPRLAVLVDVATRAGTVIREVQAGDELTVGDFRFSVLWPDAAAAATWSENNRSVVLRVDVSGHGVLLTGDIEELAEGAVRLSASGIGSALLKVPHHGSRTSSTEQFLRGVTPELVVIQVGAHNRYGHPDRETLSRLEATGAAVLRTDVDGAVMITFGRERIFARSIASGRKFAVGTDQASSSDPEGDTPGPTVTNVQFSGSMMRLAAFSTSSRVTAWMMDG